MAAAEQSRKPMVEHALEYLSMGFPVFPVCSPLMGVHQHRLSGGRMADCPPDKRGKNPMTSWKSCQTGLPSQDEVRSWWRRWPSANIGMATGALSGVIVLDCDNGEARQLALDRGGLEKAPAVWTGTPGGIHFWMAHPGYEVHNFVKDIPGTDFRGDGGYVLLPPSVHRNHGAVYRWNEHTLGRKPPAVPEWLAELFKAKETPTASGESFTGDVLDVEEMLRGFDAGGRDTGLFKLAARFRRDDQPQAYAEALIQVAARNCRPPFDLAEAVEKVVYVYGKYASGGVGPTVDFDEEIRPPHAAPGPETAPPPLIFLRPISELLAMPEVDPDWLVDQLFTVGSNGWVAAEPKAGKSWTVLELVRALATGTAFLGRFAVKQPRRTLYIQEEDSLQRVLRRFKQMLKGDPSQSPPSDEYLLWSIRAGFKIDSDAWMEKLRQEIEAFSAEVIVLDVFNRLHGSDENKQAEMTAILNALTTLTNQYGCSFIIVHHNRKPQAGSEARANQLMRGSGVLAGWAECSLYLRKGKEKHVLIVTPESKDAPELDDFSITLRDLDSGGILLEVGGVSVTERTSKLDAEIIEAVGKVNREGLDATIQRIAETLGKERTTVGKRLPGLVDEGLLEMDEVQIGRHYVKIYTTVSQ